MADMLGIDRRINKGNPNYQAIKTGNIPNGVSFLRKHLIEKTNDLDGEWKDWRLKTIVGIDKEKHAPIFDKSRYAFLIDAPFNISSMCCKVMKKAPTHTYSRKTGRKPITAQMASESRLRSQQWLRNGCNGFDMKLPISNPMAFWTEQDVLLYIEQNKLEIASVYGEIVNDFNAMGSLEGQMELSDLSADLEIFDIGRPLLKTSGCSRTGCAFCGYGCHLEKPEESRWEISKKVSNPNIVDFCMRGGAFDEDGLWKPDERGLGYWFVMKWINIHGNMNLHIPNYEKYEREYGTDETKRYLEINPN